MTTSCTTISFLAGQAEPPTHFLGNAPHFDAVPDMAVPLGRIWLVDPSFAWRAVPAGERYAVCAIMRGGQGVLVCGYCQMAVYRAVAGLFRLRIFDGAGEWCGHG